MKLSLTLLFLQLWGNVELSLSQNDPCQVGKMHPRLFVAGLPPTNEIIKTGHKLQFQCSKDLTLDGSEEIECLENGQWSAPFPTCSVLPGMNCTVPVIANGAVLGGVQEYKENQVLDYQCDLQYKRAEERQSKCITVGTNAEWSPTPACERIKCEVKLPALGGTQYEPASRNLFSPGDTLRVLCGEKHWIVNHQTTSAVTTCQSDGEWSMRPLCQEVICSNQRDDRVSRWDVYWYDQKKLGDSVYYRCHSGYESTSRNNHATCTRDGWTPKPLCRAPVGCGKPPPLADGDTKETVKIHYIHNEKVEYLCQNVYRMEGGPFKTCQNGEWVGQMRCLKPCTVDEEVMRRRNIRFAYSYEAKLYAPHDDAITFACTYRTRPVGSVEMIQKCIDGVMNFPTCG